MVQALTVLVTLLNGQVIQSNFLADVMGQGQFREDTLVGVPDEELVARAQQEAARLMSRRGPVASSQAPDGSRSLRAAARDRIEDTYTGVPDEIKQIDPTGKRFRYYVYHGQIAASIAQSKRIVGGQAHLKHIRQYARTHLEWVDLKGIYFAAADALPEEVGMVGTRYFIEFEVLPGTPVLDVGFKDKGIFMVPTGGKDFTLPIRITDIGDADREGNMARYDCEQRAHSGKVIIPASALPTPSAPRSGSGLR